MGMHVSNDEFWAIIDRSLVDSDGGLDDQTEHLRRLLGDLPDAALAAFDAAFVAANRRLYSWQNWGAATVMLGGCSDDTFTDFRSWVISRGRQVYERFVDDPDSIVEAGLDDDEEIGLAEGFSYIASELLAERPDTAISDALPDRESLEPEDMPAGERFDDRDEALAARYPRLAGKYLRDAGGFEQAQGRPSRLPNLPRTKDCSTGASHGGVAGTQPTGVQGPGDDRATAAELGWLVSLPGFDFESSFVMPYQFHMEWLVERMVRDPEWCQWWASSNRAELELMPFYSRSEKESSRVKVSKARVSVAFVLDASRYQDVVSERLREQAVEDLESMIEAARSRLDLAACPALPTARRSGKDSQEDEDSSAPFGE